MDLCVKSTELDCGHEPSATASRAGVGASRSYLSIRDWHR